MRVHPLRELLQDGPAMRSECCTECLAAEDSQSSGPGRKTAAANVFAAAGLALAALLGSCLLLFAVFVSRRRRRRRYAKKMGPAGIGMDDGTYDQTGDRNNSETANLLYGSSSLELVGVGETATGARTTRGNRASANPLFGRKATRALDDDTGDGVANNPLFFGNDHGAGGSADANMLLFADLQADNDSTHKWRRTSNMSVYNPLVGDGGNDESRQAAGAGLFFGGALAAGAAAKQGAPHGGASSSSGAVVGAENTTTQSEMAALALQDSMSQDDLFIAVEAGEEELAALESVLVDLETGGNAVALAQMRADIESAKVAYQELGSEPSGRETVRLRPVGDLGPGAKEKDFAKALARARKRLQKVQQSATAASGELAFNDREKLLSEIQKVRKRLRATGRTNWKKLQAGVRVAAQSISRSRIGTAEAEPRRSEVVVNPVASAAAPEATPADE